MKDDKSLPAPVNEGGRPLSVIEYAAKSGATPEQLQTMLELQVRADNHQLELMREKRRMDEEDRKRDALLAFRRDFTLFRGKNIVIAKDKHVDRGRAGSFNQAEYHAIAQQISPALSEFGFSFRHGQDFGTRTWPTPENPNNVIPWVTVTCYLEHKDGHFESLKLEGPMGDQSANTEVQNMQLTASYLKRQSLLAITGTATGGEDDENDMRNTRGDRGRPAPVQDAEFERILQDGRDSSLLGMKPLTAWWQGLSPAARKMMDPEFGSLRKAAALVDKGGAK